MNNNNNNSNSNSPSTSNASAIPASSSTPDLTLNSLTKEKLNIVLQVSVFPSSLQKTSSFTNTFFFPREQSNFKLQASKKMVKMSFLS